MGYKDKEEQAEYQRKWIARRRSEFLDGKSCVECGSDSNLEIDHVDPNAKVAHRVWSWAKERRDRELRKCQILCHDCHVEKTKKDPARPRSFAMKRDRMPAQPGDGMRRGGKFLWRGRWRESARESAHKDKAPGREPRKPQ